MDLWNHYDNRGPKTNNHVEGFNSKIKRFFSSHPNIWKFILRIKSEESNCNFKICSFKSRILKERGRRTFDLEKDLKILDLKNQSIDLLEYIISLTDFSHDYSS